jgi:mannose-6-phosphate isomerase-like protein (cupin superfamily)
MTDEQFQARYRTLDEIRSSGAIGNLQDGTEITTNGVQTRLIAWPGNGFQTESVHVLTLHPGEESDVYAYGMAEEAMLCLSGRGEVFLRGNWREIQPGDIAYFPEAVAHAVRSSAGAKEDLVVVTQITPPQLELYERGGFYQRAEATLNRPAIFKATVNATRVEIPRHQMEFREAKPEVSAEHLAPTDVRIGGAIFNVYSGTPFPGLGIPARLILWPGAGTRTAGFNFALAPARAADRMHIHPVSDECLILWDGVCEGYTAPGYTGSQFVPLDTYDVILAPCGVLHGHRSTDAPSVLGGFASPPQPDLLLDAGLYQDGVFAPATFERLDTSQANPVSLGSIRDTLGST